MKLAACIGLIFALACSDDASPSRSPSPSRAPSPSPSRSPSPDHAHRVVLVLVDGLDAAAITPTAMPRLTALATEGHRFTMRSAGGDPIVAAGVLLSSVPPPLLGVEDAHRSISPTVWTLVDVMRCRDVESAAFFASGWRASPYSGLARSWPHVVRAPTAGEAVTDVLAWLDGVGDEGAFVLLEVAVDDAAIGALADGVRRGRHGTDTLFVVTAGIGGDDSDLRAPGEDVPLILSVAGVPVGDTDLVSALDVAPTILEAMGLPLPRSFYGRSLGATHVEVPESDRVAPAPYVPPPLTRERCLQLVQMGYGTIRSEDCAALPSSGEREAARYASLASTLCPR